MQQSLIGNLEVQKIEKKWQDNWYNSDLYKWDENIAREDSFIIDTPPPTISGMLHMGHVFSYTQADFVARYKRMRGMNVFYPMGFDDNGLPTERLVEKVKNVRAVNMERAEFVKLCEEVVADAEDEFRDLFKSIALSVDWSQEYQTISKRSTAISQMSFIDLLNKGVCYRQMEPTLWDTVDQTALAQADVVDGPQKTFMNNILFSDENGKKYEIATTRPELLPACVAVFYHPDDERYKHLKGQYFYSPIFKVKVPIIADDKVSIEKGTGLVMCCTFGDITDIEWWRIHKLPLRIIISKHGKLSHIKDVLKDIADCDDLSEIIAELSDLKIKAARARMIEILQEHNLLTKQEEIENTVKCGERSGSPLEILVTPQWCVNLLDHKEALLAKANECKWYPSYMKTRVDNWINGLQWDWVISRQRFFGVPFPIWYSKRAGEEGKVLIADIKSLPIDPLKDLPEGYSKEELEPDFDVMDTWATSSVSPQLNSWGISEDMSIDNVRHSKLFPADLRPQAHEIIRTWAFYTIAKAYFHQDTIPWKNLMISGWCLAADKTKMSKSKGNIVTPTSLIIEKGTDIVRYWASNSKLGADIVYSEEIFKIGKKLINKLWNASKFASSHFLNHEVKYNSAKDAINAGAIYEPIDLWLISKLGKAITKATDSFEQFEYSDARAAIEDFFWNDLCDNYLEIVKIRVYNEQRDEPKAQYSAVCTLFFVLDAIIRLFAPFMPHVTEELHDLIYKTGKSIHDKFSWVDSDNYPTNDIMESCGIDCVNILDLVRKAKADRNISPKASLEFIRIYGAELSNVIIRDLQDVTNTADITINNMVQNDNFDTTIDGKYKVEIM
jgi:valyl-tRNA synthetase